LKSALFLSAFAQASKQTGVVGLLRSSYCDPDGAYAAGTLTRSGSLSLQGALSSI
jgi:hypothetical protein